VFEDVLGLGLRARSYEFTAGVDGWYFEVWGFQVQELRVEGFKI